MVFACQLDVFLESHKSTDEVIKFSLICEHTETTAIGVP